MTMERLMLDRALLRKMTEHAGREAPLEACGIVSGKGLRGEAFHPMTNADHSAEHFSMEPREQFVVARRLRALGHEILAIFHSHPATPARPSEEDIRLAATPGVVYLILSLAGAEPLLKGFWIDGLQVTEVPVEVEPEALLRLPAAAHADVADYRRRVEEYLGGATSPLAFRAYRVPMGVYEQRQTGRFMVRVRIGAGLALPGQLRRIAELSQAHGNGVAHVTTRQDLQIHDVGLADTATVQEKLLEVGLSARGGGGNTVRNITACPRSSVCPKAVFDVAPHAIALAEQLLADRSSFNLPRKFKIAFSACADDCAFASVNDVGLFAHERDGRRGFAAYAGGGLGPKPRAGVLIEEFVSEDEVFEVAEAVRDLFDQLGDRADKHHARLRYVVGRLGDAGFIQAYRERREAVRVRAAGRTKPSVRSLAAYFPEDPAGTNGLTPPGALVDLQAGKCTVELRLSHGQISARGLSGVADVSERLGAGVVVTTQDQNLLLPGITISRVAEVREALGALGISLGGGGPKLVACAGASTCKLGLCLSPALADELAPRLREFTVGGVVPSTIRISGCANSCGNHSIAELGLVGTTRRHQGRLLPCYEVVTGGAVTEGHARLAERVGVVPARSVPELLVRVLTGGELRVLVDQYAKIPERLPEQYFVDFGANEPFSLEGRGPGECGAGVLDIVRADLEEARAALATGGEPTEGVYRATVASARALLPIFGLEAKKDREVFEFFSERLIEPGWVKAEARNLIDAVVDWRLGDLDSLDDWAAAAKDLSLDGQLEFRVPKLGGKTERRAPEAPKPKELDLTGVACPMNFVRAKIALEKMPIGATLEVLLDDGEPIRNVPASLTGQGQEVLAVSPEGGQFRVRVRRAK
jgi:sulfite reductase (ferredoxin)